MRPTRARRSAGRACPAPPREGPGRRSSTGPGPALPSSRSSRPRFRKQEPVPVHGFLGAIVRAEEHAVLVPQDELTGSARLPAQLRVAGPRLHHHVRVAVEDRAGVVQVLRVVGHVQGDEGGSGVPGEDSIAGGEEDFLGREAIAVEAPVRVLLELVVALVVAVDRGEEGIGVADLDGDRDAEGVRTRPIQDRGAGRPPPRARPGGRGSRAPAPS